jgi:hypothetical protein
MQLRILALLTATGLGLFAFTRSHATLASDTPANGKRVPVIVELFTSEGCSDCPPADALLRKLEQSQPVSNAEVIVLGEHVDYWNYIGWTDRFSSSKFTDRQRRYVSDFALDSAYTPQMVVDGRAEFNGQNEVKARKAIADSANSEHANVQLSSASPETLSVKIDAIPASAKKADVVLAITESGLQTEVRKGENQGRTLDHTGVVREMRIIGKVEGQDFTAQPELKLGSDWKRANLTAIVFVQEKGSGHIIGAGITRLDH